jgi:hypothetical protein
MVQRCDSVILCMANGLSQMRSFSVQKGVPSEQLIANGEHRDYTTMAIVLSGNKICYKEKILDFLLLSRLC